MLENVARRDVKASGWRLRGHLSSDDTGLRRSSFNSTQVGVRRRRIATMRLATERAELWVGGVGHLQEVPEGVRWA